MLAYPTAASTRECKGVCARACACKLTCVEKYAVDVCVCTSVLGRSEKSQEEGAQHLAKSIVAQHRGSFGLA